MFRPAGKDYGKPVRVLAAPQISDRQFQKALKKWKEEQKQKVEDANN